MGDEPAHHPALRGAAAAAELRDGEKGEKGQALPKKHLIRGIKFVHWDI
jgi:hypothetical protein